MSKGILVSIAGYPYSLTSLMPDNGLANLAGALVSQGHEVKIIDYGTVDSIEHLVPPKYRNRLKEIYKSFTTENKKGTWISALELKILTHFLEREVKNFNHIIIEELTGLIKKEKPDYLGFKLWLGDGLELSINVATILKKRFPKLKIYGGGPLVDLVKETFYKKTSIFDAIAYGEGEETIIGLANHSIGEETLENIPNLIYLTDKGTRRTESRRILNLNDLPFPVYEEDIYPSLKGNQKIKVFTLDESRGCPNHCAFCPHIDKSGDRWRVKTPERVLQEISNFIHKYKTNTFRYGGSNPPFNLLVDVAKLLISHKMKVEYSSFAHVNNMDINKLSLLRNSGLRSFSFGIESGDDYILKEIMLKIITSSEIKKVLKASLDSGIYTVASIIFPAPGETARSKNNTLNLLLDIFKNRDNNCSVQVYFPGLYPTSIWGKNPEKFGFQMKYSLEDYKIKYMNYKIKRLFPPRFWKPLPYTINHVPYKKFVKETENIIGDLEKNNIPTMISDEMALLSHAYDPTLSVADFRDLVREILFTGDVFRVREILDRINQNIKKSINV